MTYGGYLCISLCCAIQCNLSVAVSLPDVQACSQTIVCYLVHSLCTNMQAFSNSIDGATALLDCQISPVAALVGRLQLLPQQPDEQDMETAVAAMQCLSNLTRGKKGVDVALEAQLPLCIVTVVTEVSLHLSA